MNNDPLRSRICRFLSQDTGPRGTHSFGDLSVASTLGRVRKENQDAALIVSARYGGQPDRDFDVAVLCDGMGGMKGGREAAQTALCTFITRIIRTTRSPIAKRLFGAIDAANRDVYRLLSGRGGTTLSALVVERSRVPTCVHVGDSRIYALSRSNMMQLSKDDTIDAALNRDRPLDDVRDNRLLQFVGMGDDLEPHVFNAPADADRFLLTSDGAHDLPPRTFQRAVINASDPIALTSTLIRMSEFVGGLDNATAASLPSRLTSPDYDARDGLDLQLISAFGRLDIWIPQLQEEKRDPSLKQGPDNVGEALPVDQAPAQKNDKPKSVRSRKRPSLVKKAKSATEALQQATLKIEFPEGGDK